jgi:predicted metal-dependent hydrolase
MNIEEIPVVIVRTPPKKTVSMRVVPTRSGGTEVQVRASKRVSEEFIREFVRERQPWILKQAARLSGTKNIVEQMDPMPNKKEVLRIFSEHYRAMLHVFNIPAHRAPRLSIRLMKSRWGSYRSGTHSIALNSQLARVDARLLDYVIAHELAHIDNLHHGLSFYSKLAQHMPDFKERRGALRATESALLMGHAHDA